VKNNIQKLFIFGAIALYSSIALGAEQYSYFKDAYITAGFGKSLPQGKISSFTFDAGNNHYAKKKLKNANVYKFAIGKGFSQFRTEIEFLHIGKHKFNNSDRYLDSNYTFHTKHNVYFLNGYYDFKKFHSSIVPYVGVGLGLSQNTVSKKDFYSGNAFVAAWNKKRNTSFAYNASLGVLFNVNKNFYFDLSYKFVNLGKLKGSNTLVHANGVSETTETSVKGKVKANILMIGAGLKF